MSKRTKKKIRIHHETVNNLSEREIEPWETCKTKREAYKSGYRNGADNRERHLTEDIESLKRDIINIKSAREGERTQIKSRLIEHIGNATNDLSRLIKEI